MKFRKTGVKGKGLHLKALAHARGLAGTRKRYSRRYQSAAGNVRMVGHDLMGTLTISENAQESEFIFTKAINPVELGFPAMATEAQLHQQFLFDAFDVHMPNTATSFINGDSLGWFDRDPNEVVPVGIEGLQIGFYKGGQVGVFKKGHTWTMPHFPNLPELFIADNGSDDRLTQQCVFNLQIVTPPSVYNSGAAEQVSLVVEFWASYSIEFRVKDISRTTNLRSVFVKNNTLAVTLDANDPLGWTATGSNTMTRLSYDDNYPCSRLAPNHIPGLTWGKITEFGTSYSFFGIQSGYSPQVASLVMETYLKTTVFDDYVQLGSGAIFYNAVNGTSAVPWGTNPMTVFQGNLKESDEKKITNTLIRVVLSQEIPGVTSNIFLDEGGWQSDPSGVPQLLPPGFYEMEFFMGLKGAEGKWNPTAGDEPAMVSCFMITSEASHDIIGDAGDATVEGQARVFWTLQRKLQREGKTSVCDKYTGFTSYLHDLRKARETPRDETQLDPEAIRKERAKEIKVQQSTDPGDIEELWHELKPVPLDRRPPRLEIRSEPPTPETKERKGSTKSTR